LTGEGIPGPPAAAVVTVGDELLMGESVDTNGTWLAQALARVGLAVVGRWVTGDVPSEIQRTVRSALDWAEVVVVTGGLGPTPDDRTRESVADLLGLALEEDEELLERLKGRFRARGYGHLPEKSRVMALVPAGGGVLPNPLGAAPGLVLETPEGRLCVLLPGVPAEMRAVFLDGVEPFLRFRFEDRLQGVVHRVIHTAGIPESLLMTRVEELLAEGSHGVSLAYLPDLLGVRLRLTARASREADDAEARLTRVEDRLGPLLEQHGYQAETGDLAETVGRALLEGEETLAVAESCTGGLISKRMTDLAGSSHFFRGGVVAYANEVKSGLLGIPEEPMMREGVVSEWTAKAMAEAVARKLQTSVGLGVTGIAGPGGGSPEKPVGTVWYAVWHQNRIFARRELFLGDRSAVRARAAHATLWMLLRVLEGKDP
jgi:nicotinamide-nucleotide amidase